MLPTTIHYFSSSHCLTSGLVKLPPSYMVINLLHKLNFVVFPTINMDMDFSLNPDLIMLPTTIHYSSSSHCLCSGLVMLPPPYMDINLPNNLNLVPLPTINMDMDSSHNPDLVMLPTTSHYSSSTYCLCSGLVMLPSSHMDINLPTI